MPSAGSTVSPPSVNAIALVDARLTARASSAFAGAARRKQVGECKAAVSANGARTWRIVGAHNLQVREACLQGTAHLEIRSPAAVSATSCEPMRLSAPVRSGRAERDVDLATQAEHVQRRRRRQLRAPRWSATATPSSEERAHLGVGQRLAVSTQRLDNLAACCMIGVSACNASCVAKARLARAGGGRRRAQAAKCLRRAPRLAPAPASDAHTARGERRGAVLGAALRPAAPAP